jgi:ABC-2 type transport system ATP-binding protein
LSDVAIHIHELSRDFGKVRAVDRLTFDVGRGMLFGFLGPNGAGKTTTIRLLLGLLEATEGGAEVLGFDIGRQADDIRRQTGALLEHTGLYERISAEDNLDFYGRIWHLPRADRQARIRELLTHLGLWERRKESVGKWSRGMKQKLSIARALLHHPQLIFFDEPTAGLDPIAAAGIREDLATLASREGVTVFLTTHNLVEAEKLCHQVGVIRNGRLLAVDTPQQLRAHHGAPRMEIHGRGFSDNVLALLRARPEVLSLELQDHRLLVTLQGAPDTAPLVSLLVGAGVQVEEVRRGNPSLEEVFLTLMEEEQ